MTHITFSAKTLSKPSLEFYSDGASDPRHVTIEKCPFTIGRAESSDLRIDSPKVSRDHAEIVERGGVWFVRDVGSTNGTHVNGKQVTEAMLADGDILKVAETELTFVASAATKFQRMATQPIHARDRLNAPTSIPLEVVAARTVTEATLLQAIPQRLLTLTSVEQGANEAMFSILESTARGDEARLLFRSNHRAAIHFRELFRRRAVEAAKRQNSATRLFVAVDSLELESPHQLLASLELLQEYLPASWEFGVTIPSSAVLETPRMNELYQAARNQGLLIDYDEFQGNGGQVTQFESCVPDYLLLSESMTKGLENSSDARQPLRRLESVIAACEELVTSPVLPHGLRQSTIDMCRQVGYVLTLRSTIAPAPKEARLASMV